MKTAKYLIIILSCITSFTVNAQSNDSLLAIAEKMVFSDPVKTIKICNKLLKESKNDSVRAEASYFRGIAFMRSGNYVSGLKDFIESLRYHEQKKNRVKTATLLNSIGNVYMEQGENDKAESYYFKALDLYKSLKDLNGVALVEANLANIRYYKNDYKEAEKLALSSLAYYKGKANIEKISNLQIALSSIYSETQRIDEAIDLLKEALKHKKDLNDAYTVSGVTANMAILFQAKKQHDESIRFFKEAIETAKPIKAYSVLKYCYESLSLQYAELGRHQDSYEYLLLFGSIKDTMLNQENSKIMAGMHEEYETEKKEQEIVLLKKGNQINELKLKQKELYNYAFSGGAVLFLLISLVSYKGYAAKKKDNAELEKKFLLINSQKQVIEEKNRDITDSIIYANRIQQALLKPINQLGNDSFILLKPRDIVSGDFYWYDNTGEHVLIAVADCSGHGVPGAFMSVLGNNAIHKVIKEERLLQPDKILHSVDSYVYNVIGKNHGKSSHGIDMGMLLITPTLNGALANYAGANNTLWVVSKQVSDDEKLKVIKGDNCMLGTNSGNNNFTTHELSLLKGDCVYMFTDGIVDQFGGEDGKKFKASRLRELLLGISHKPMSEQKDLLEDAFVSWKKNHEQVDDICFIGYRI